ncbi:MAG: penicillin-binding protein 1C [Candidatus Electrothrix sp. YB6]
MKPENSRQSIRNRTCTISMTPAISFFRHPDMNRRLSILGGCIVLTCLGIFLLDLLLPSPLPGIFPMPCSTRVVDRNGRVLRLFTTKGGYWRLPARLDDRKDGTAVDPAFIRLLLACEDKRFWTHHGVDLLAAGRAFVQFITHGRVVSGASTITMQTVRLLRPHPRTLAGKVFEMIQAVRLERLLSKQEILETYLTLAPYGGNIEGIEAACLFYFQKNAARITPSQAALLISLPQSPEQRRPDRRHAQAVTARNTVLSRLEENNLLSTEQAVLGRTQPVPRKRGPTPFLAPHLSERLHWARPAQEIIRTSLDSRLQEQLEKIAGQVQERLGAGGHKTLAMLVIENRTRQVLAHVGSGSYWLSRLDLTRASRSPGSALKPFIYGMAFEQGFLHPETRILDRPVRYGSYGPGNFDGTFQGWIAVREALHRSLNLPAVQVLARVGPQRLLSRFAGLGLAVDPNRLPGLSLALGGTSVTLQELVALYAAFAEQGRYRRLSFTPDAPAPEGKRMLSRTAAWYVDEILRTMPLTSGLSAESIPGGRIRYKTGTSYGFRDAWAIGYNQQYTIGIWIGRPDWGYGKHTTGANSAVPVLFQVFAALPSARSGQERGGELRHGLPAGVILGRHDQLPPYLQRFSPSSGKELQTDVPRIYFPVNGSTVQLEQKKLPVLVLKARGGTPPFHWLVNGIPLGREHSEPVTSYTPQGEGLAQIILVDSRGKRDKVSVWVDTGGTAGF